MGDALDAHRKRIRERIGRGTGGNGGGSNSETLSGTSEENRLEDRLSSDEPQQFGSEPEPTIIEIQRNTIETEGRNKRRSKGTGGNENGTGTTGYGETRTAGGKRKENKNTKKKTVTLDLEDDTEDITNLVVGIFDGLANITQYPGFSCDKQEAETIARPAARIMARHGFTDSVRKVSDPLALAIASFTLVAPRIAAYKMYIEAIKQEQLKQPGVQVPYTNGQTTVQQTESPQGHKGYDFGSTPG